MSDARTQRNPFYLAAWRWHFYAGLFVVPFVLVLASSGLLMVLNGPIESIRYADRLFVTPAAHMQSAGAQLEAVRTAYADSTVTMYIPPRAADRSAQISITPPGDAHAGHSGHGGHDEVQSLTIFVNPYTGAILGTLNPASTLYAWAKGLHGSLFLGELGDSLIEIAAGFGVLLIVSGLFLWWPRAPGELTLRPRRGNGSRQTLRSLHASLGFWVAVPLTFFLFSGLAWTSVWGEKFVQAWSTLPAERLGAPTSAMTHADLNRGVLKEVPWALEQTPLPLSASAQATGNLAPIDLDRVVAFARKRGFTSYRVYLPRGADGVWTVSAIAMNGDVRDPRAERTVHLDRHTGKVIAEIGFADYSAGGKAMAAGIALHQGEAGPFNVALNVAFCMVMITLASAAVVMWWSRRPTGALGIAPPPLPANARNWKLAVGLMLLLSLAFPLVAATLVCVMVLDWLLLSRVPRLRAMFR